MNVLHIRKGFRLLNSILRTLLTSSRGGSRIPVTPTNVSSLSTCGVNTLIYEDRETVMVLSRYAPLENDGGLSAAGPRWKEACPVPRGPGIAGLDCKPVFVNQEVEMAQNLFGPGNRLNKALYISRDWDCKQATHREIVNACQLV